MNQEYKVKEINTRDGRIIAYCPECAPIQLEYDDFNESWNCNLCGFNQGEV